MPTVATNFRSIIQSHHSKTESVTSSNPPEITHETLFCSEKLITQSNNTSAKLLIEEEIKPDISNQLRRIQPNATSPKVRLIEKYRLANYSTQQLSDTKEQIHRRNPIAKFFLWLRKALPGRSAADIKSEIKSENCIAAGKQLQAIGYMILDSKTEGEIGDKAKNDLLNLIGGTDTQDALPHYEVKDNTPITYFEKQTNINGVRNISWTTTAITKDDGWTGSTMNRFILKPAEHQGKIANIIEVTTKAGKDHGNQIRKYKIYTTTKDGDTIKPINQSKCVLDSSLSQDNIEETLDNIDLAIKAEEKNLQRLYPLNNEEKSLIQDSIRGENLDSCIKISKQEIDISTKRVASIKKDVDRPGSITNLQTRDEIQKLFLQLEADKSKLDNENYAKIITSCNNYQGHLFQLIINFNTILHKKNISPESLQIKDPNYEFEGWDSTNSSATIKHTCPIVKNGITYDEKFQVTSVIKFDYNKGSNLLKYEVTNLNSQFI